MAEITESLLLAMANRDGYRDRDDRDGYRTEQNQANMSLMAAVGAVDKAVAVGSAAMEASQAAQSASIVSQLNNVAGSLAARTDGVKETVNAMSMVLAQQLAGIDRSIMENRYELAKDITADGDKTRDRINSINEISLNRQLTDANAALIELRSEDRANRRAYDNSLNVTQTVNQAQAQSQQLGQFDRLYHMLADATQSIRATNQAINFGAGTLTNTPTTTSTNNRVS